MIIITWKEKVIGVIILLILFFMFYTITNGLATNENRKILQRKFKDEFSGIVAIKYEQRGCRIIIKGVKGMKGGVFEIASSSSSLYDSVRIGDTIIKEVNTNHCAILRGKRIDCDCYYWE